MVQTGHTEQAEQAEQVGRAGRTEHAERTGALGEALQGSGVRPGAVLRLLETLDERKIRMHSLLLRRHGRVIFRADWVPYEAERPHILYSLSKCFTSLAVGIAEHGGYLSRTDRLMDYAGDLLEAPPSPLMRELTLEHLLTMTTGHATEPAYLESDHPERQFMTSYIAYPPGSRFLYNTPATYMLAYCVEKVTGQSLIDYLSPRLLEPLGIRQAMGWGKSPTGTCWGGIGVAAPVEAIGRIGELLLRRGRWHDKQLVPAEWVDAMHAAHADPAATGNVKDWGVGYGYQIWGCTLPHAFRADGAFGQYCVVCPDQDLVIANTAGIEDLQGLLDVYWAFVADMEREPEGPAEAVAAEDARDLERLARKVRHLDAWPALEASATEPQLESAASSGDAEGKEGEATAEPAMPPAEGRYRLSTNPQGFRTLTWEARDGGYRLTLTREGAPLVLDLQAATWVPATAEGGYRPESGKVDMTADEALVCRLRDPASTGGAICFDIVFPGGPMSETWVLHRAGREGVALTTVRRTSFLAGTHEILGVRL